MICLLGIAGSGKTTQGQILAQRLNCPRLYTGAILRQYATGEARRQLEAGELVDDQVTIQLLDQEFKRLNVKEQECILDGSPRSLPQAEWLSAQFKSGTVKYTAILHLTLDKAAAMERLLSRARSDDLNEGIINQRFKEYDERMGPVRDYLQSQGQPVTEIDASGTIEAVTASMMAALGLQ